VRSGRRRPRRRLPIDRRDEQALRRLPAIADLEAPSPAAIEPPSSSSMRNENASSRIGDTDRCAAAARR